MYFSIADRISFIPELAVSTIVAPNVNTALTTQKPDICVKGTFPRMTSSVSAYFSPSLHGNTRDKQRVKFGDPGNIITPYNVTFAYPATTEKNENETLYSDKGTILLWTRSPSNCVSNFNW